MALMAVQARLGQRMDALVEALADAPVLALSALRRAAPKAKVIPIVTR
jgi:hypothetical protein